MRRLGFLSLSLAVLLGGCSDTNLVARADDDSAPGPVDDDDSGGADDDDSASPPPGELSVTPAGFDFGLRPVGCNSLLTVLVANVGEGPLRITGMDYTASPGLTSDPLPDLPIQLPANWVLEFTVFFTPLGEDGDEGLLTVSSDGGDATASQFGAALAPVSASDEFLQEGNRTVDILWMVDSSGSMAAEQEALGENFSSFLAIVDQLGLDYRIGVVTADLDDGGLLHGSPAYVTADTADASAVFADNVLVGQIGSGAEQGLDSVRLALVDGAAGDFLRPSAQLRVISVSDEDDQSVSLPAVSGYIAEWQSLKASPTYVIHSDISGGSTGCNSGGATADPAPRYLEATALTGGISTPVCDANWIQTLTNLAWLADSYADTFALSQPAIPSSVTPFVDAIQVSSGWTYNSSLNAVTFDPAAVPGDGSLVRFDYSVQQPCND